MKRCSETLLSSHEISVLACDPDLAPAWCLLVPSRVGGLPEIAHLSGGGKTHHPLASPAALTAALRAARTLGIQRGAKRLVVACEGQYGEITNPSIELLTRCRHRIEVCAEMASPEIEFVSVMPSAWQATWCPGVRRKSADLLKTYRTRSRTHTGDIWPWAQELRALGPDLRMSPTGHKVRTLNDDVCAAIGIAHHIWQKHPRR